MLFLISAVAVGLARVIFEAMLSGMIFGHRHSAELLGDLAKALPPILGVYIGLKLMDLHARVAMHYVLENSLESGAFIIEMVVGALLPGTLLQSAKVRNNRLKLFSCSLMVIAGVVLNRLNVCLVGMLATSTTGYLPSWIEILVSGGIVAGGLLVLAGDLTTTRDAQRLARHCSLVQQINTGRGCHLNASQVRQGIASLPLERLDLLIIENVGNLICPVGTDLG